jgi:hypothetical protein
MTGYAQEQQGSPDQPQPQTLLGGVDHVSLYISPSAKGTRINGQNGVMAGGSAGVMLNNSIYIGAAGYRLVPEITNVKVLGTGTDSTSIGMQYIGAIVGYRFFPDALIHFGAQAMGGYGQVGTGNRHGRSHQEFIDFETGHGSKGFYTFEPSVTAEMNIISHLAFGVEAGYRFCTGLDSTTVGLTNGSLGGLSAAASLRLTVF